MKNSNENSVKNFTTSNINHTYKGLTLNYSIIPSNIIHFFKDLNGTDLKVLILLGAIHSRTKHVSNKNKFASAIGANWLRIDESFTKLINLNILKYEDDILSYNPTYLNTFSDNVNNILNLTNANTLAAKELEIQEKMIEKIALLKQIVEGGIATDEQIVEYNELKSLLNTDTPKEAKLEPKKEKTIEASTKPIEVKETAKIEVKQEVKVNHSTNNKYYQEIRDDIKQKFKIESNISSLNDELIYLEKAEIEYGKDSNQYKNQYKSFDLLYNQYLKDENKPVIEVKKEKTIEVSTKPIEVKESPNIIVSDDPDVIDTKEKFVRYYLPIVHRIYKYNDEATISTMDEYTRNDLSNIYIMAEQIDKIERWITRNEYSISNIA